VPVHVSTNKCDDVLSEQSVSLDWASVKCVCRGSVHDLSLLHRDPRQAAVPFSVYS